MQKKTICAALIAGLATSAASDARAVTGIYLETVSNYQTWTGGGSTANDTDANTEGSGFYTSMTAAGTGWTAGAFYQDNAVWDRDFYDADLTLTAGDNDTYFDNAYAAISMFIGHGQCQDAIATPCTTDAQCASGSYCPGGTAPQANTTRVCIRQQTHTLITSSTTSGHGNLVTYGQTFGQAAAKSIAWGEDAASGSFGGAGTNGGTNVGIIVNSCGIRSRYMDSTTSYMFAGVHSVMMAMPTNAIIPFGQLTPPIWYSDTVQWAARGSNFATIIQANAFAAAGDAWLNPTMVNNGFSSTGGIAANGANVIISKDSTLAKVQFHANSESWVGARSEANDAVGLGFWWNRVLCNYNCSALGM
jgi:hypothetical protein